MIVYPSDIHKYTGDIHCYNNANNVKYEVKIRSIAYYTTFNTKKDAIHDIKKKNLDLNLHIKNILYRYPTHYECSLPNDKRMLFSNQDLPFVEKYIIYESSDHPVLKIKGKVIKFSHLLLEKPNEKSKLLIHLNGNLMDCRRENIQWQRIEVYLTRKNEDSGVKKRQSVLRNGTIQCRYVAQWLDPYTRKKCSRSFGYSYGNKDGEEIAKRNAIQHRKRELQL